jgi:phospholipid-binding lipoprotein MlaA
MTKSSTVALAVTTLLLTACASQNTARQRNPQDPFERVNRPIYTFNDTLDRAIVKPAARGYRFIAPDFVETGVSNFFDNLYYPTVIVNDMLQGKVKNTFKDTGRFLVNTTVGVGGLFDPATRFGLQENDEDFGQTLGKWGLSSGPYLMLPFLGPSTVRDGFGLLVDQGTQVTTYLDDDGLRYGLTALGLLDTRARLLSAEAALGDSFDRYAVLRSVYLQRRQYQVYDGNPPEEDIEAELLEDLEEEEPKPKTPPKKR